MLESGNPAIFASGVSVDPTLPTETSPTRTPPTMTLECLIWAIFGHSHLMRQFLEKRRTCSREGRGSGQGHINISGKGLVPLSWLLFLATLAHLPLA